MKILDTSLILISLVINKLCIILTLFVGLVAQISSSGYQEYWMMNEAAPRVICYTIPLEFRQRRKLILKGNFY